MVGREGCGCELDFELWLSLLGKPSQPPLCLLGLGFVTMRPEGPCFSRKSGAWKKDRVVLNTEVMAPRGNKELHPTAESSVSGLASLLHKRIKQQGSGKFRHQGRPVSLAFECKELEPTWPQSWGWENEHLTLRPSIDSEVSGLVLGGAA